MMLMQDSLGNIAKMYTATVRVLFASIVHQILQRAIEYRVLHAHFLIRWRAQGIHDAQLEPIIYF